MNEHNCNTCGMDRTDIISQNCPDCQTFLNELDEDYEEWRTQFEEEQENTVSKEDGLKMMSEMMEYADENDLDLR